MSYSDGPRPRLFAHRGASGAHPENTLGAFAAGLDAGADRLELDVHATSDGQVVVLHDATLDRTTMGRGPIRQTTLDQVRKLAVRGGPDSPVADWRVPTLAEVLERFPGVALNVEIKQGEPSIEEDVVEVLQAHDAVGDVLLAAEDAAIMHRIRATDCGVLTGSSAPEVFGFFQSVAEGAAVEAAALPGDALQVPSTFLGMEVVTEAFVEAAHAHGREVHVWTINEVDEAERLLDLNVDGIMSDFPDRILPVLARRGLR